MSQWTEITASNCWFCECLIIGRKCWYYIKILLFKTIDASNFKSISTYIYIHSIIKIFWKPPCFSFEIIIIYVFCSVFCPFMLPPNFDLLCYPDCNLVQVLYTGAQLCILHVHVAWQGNARSRLMMANLQFKSGPSSVQSGSTCMWDRGNINWL